MADGKQRSCNRDAVSDGAGADTISHALRACMFHRHPVILDAAIQSLGIGFVGTDRSTFSVLSRRRVLDWQDGAARMVLWGYKGADDH